MHDEYWIFNHRALIWEGSRRNSTWSEEFDIASPAQKSLDGPRVMYEPFSRISRGGQLKIISSFGFAEGIESYCKKRSESSLLLPRPFLANINNYVNGRCCGRYANQDTAGKLLSLGKVPTLW